MKNWFIIVIVVIIILALVIIFTQIKFKKTEEGEEKETGEEEVKMKLSSPAFSDNGMIPAKYTCDSENVNPELIIEKIPENTQSLVLIVDDPDAPAKIWVHWVLFNIAADTKKIEEDSVPIGSIQGINDFGNNNYGGPCPPSGTHRYKFKLYALDTELALDETAKKSDVEKAIKGHILAETVLTGKYSKG